MPAKEIFTALTTAFLGKLANCFGRSCFAADLYQMHGLEAFSLYIYQLKLLDFVINRFFMNMFRTSNMHVVSV